MALAPISQISTPYEDYPNYWLKGYAQGTTTPISMATDGDGGTLLAKAEISGGGTVPIGFIKTTGDAIFIPYYSAAYDLYLFPTEAEADADDTSNAIQVADDMSFLLGLVSSEEEKVSDMVANVSLDVGETVNTLGYSAAGDGGGGFYLIVASQPADDKQDHTLLNGNVAVFQLNDGSINSRQVGGNETATIYVDPAGTDTGRTGFNPAEPLATLQAAFNILSNYKAFLGGRWAVELAAGTYVGGGTLDSMTQTDYPIDVNGPDVGGHPNVPTAILDMTTTPSSPGAKCSNGSWIRVFNVKVINAITGSGFECSAAFLALTNCHTFNCLKGLTNLHRGFASVRGGDWDGNNLANSDGYQTFFNATHDLVQSSNDAATDALLIHDFNRGFLINEGVQGHTDNVNILDCNFGINIKRGAGANNNKTMKIDGCGVGVLAENNAWYNNGLQLGTISPNTIPIKTLGVSPELIRRTVTTEFFGNDVPAFNIAAHTGTVSTTTIRTLDTFPMEFMFQDGHRFYGELEVLLSNVSAVNTIVDITMGSTQLASVSIPSAETSAIIKFSGVVLDVSATDNIVTTMEYMGRSGATDYNPALDTVDMGSADRSLTLRVTLGGTSDSLTVRLGTYGTTVGG